MELCYNFHKGRWRKISLKSLRKNAFTLAEVLITLGIIGVVAALTIPTLINNANDRATVTAVKKAYSILAQAYSSSVNDNGEVSGWDLAPGNNAASAQKALNYLAPYLKITKNCGISGGCFSGYYNEVSGTRDMSGMNLSLQNANTTWATAQLADGSMMAVLSAAVWWQGLYIIVDTNGLKGPNQYGKDTFWFTLNTSGLSPTNGWQASLAYCDRDNYTDDSNNGRACTAWVLKNENLDYLHCDDLDWNNKTKCN